MALCHSTQDWMAPHVPVITHPWSTQGSDPIHFHTLGWPVVKINTTGTMEWSGQWTSYQWSTLLCLISILPRIIAMRYQLYDFDKHTPSNKSTHLPLTVEVWIFFAWHVCEDDICLIINKNNLTITSFFHDNIVVRDCYLFFTCIYLSIFILFFFIVEHLVSRQTMLYMFE